MRNDAIDCSAQELKLAGFSLDELRGAGFDLDALAHAQFEAITPGRDAWVDGNQTVTVVVCDTCEFAEERTPLTPPLKCPESVVRDYCGNVLSENESKCFCSSRFKKRQHAYLAVDIYPEAENSNKKVSQIYASSIALDSSLT